MTVEEILTNYNKLGTELIETIYFDDYLSIGGTASTDTLAEKAGITSESHVLDVGSGVGGPALHLAATYGCTVTGLDLVEPNVVEANGRAADRGLQNQAMFHAGNALDMPFENDCFDVIWGQDAWCHVPDKDKLIEECSRVVRSGGVIAYTDWIETGEISGLARTELLSAMAAPNLATMASYQASLEKHGCTMIGQEDVSEVFVEQYRGIMAGLADMKEKLTEKYSAKIYHIVAERNGCILRGFESGALGGGRIIARKN